MLSIIKTPRKIRKFLTYDLEWVPGSLKVRVVGVYDGTNYRSYSSVSSFLDEELTHKNRGKWFYAHAGGLADVQFVLEEVIRRNGNLKIDAAFSGSSAIRVTIGNGKDAWHFIDSYWLLHDSLANIGKSLGMEKGGIKYDLSNLSDEEFEAKQRSIREWYATVSITELIDYNEQDCKILWHAINQFEDTLLGFGGQLQMTIASCAMHLFRRKYLSDDIETNDWINDRVRSAYIASRVEVFERDVKDAFYYDINSSFPNAMRSESPGKFDGFSQNIPKSKLYVADATVFVPESYMPPLPFRSKSGRIFFPTGTWRCHFSNVDIELLEKMGGRIEKIHECLVFNPFDDLRKYAENIYDARKKASSPFEKIVFKYLLNSLYGKFAERKDKQSLRVYPSEINDDKMKMLFPGVFMEDRQAIVSHIHVPVSMHITALARKYLYEHMHKCRDVHYCDTDGFSTSEQLNTSNELGDIKLEKKIIDGHYVLPKLYHQKAEILKKDGKWSNIDIVKAKGFSRINVARWNRIVEGESIEFERMSRIKENLKAGNISPREIRIGKCINFENVVPKRYTFSNGSTRPWRIKEIIDL